MIRAIALLLALVGTGCAGLIHPSEPHVLWAKGRWSEASLERLEAGRVLYVNECGGCHSLRQPKSRAPDRWPEIITQMEEEQDVLLDPLDRQKLVEFVMAASAVTDEEIKAAQEAQKAAATPPPAATEQNQ